jgi:hypothetical protein
MHSLDHHVEEWISVVEGKSLPGRGHVSSAAALLGLARFRTARLIAPYLWFSDSGCAATPLRLLFGRLAFVPLLIADIGVRRAAASSVFRARVGLGIRSWLYPMLRELFR